MTAARLPIALRFAVAVAMACSLLLANAAGALAAGVSFGTPTVTSQFGKAIDFYQPYTTSGTIVQAFISIDLPGSIGPFVAKGTSADGRLNYRFDTPPGQVLPNDKLVARWEVTITGGAIETGPDVTVTYTDDRFVWQMATDGLIRVHWYSYGKSQGQSWARIGAEGLAKAVDYIGAPETEPVDIYVYADTQDFMGALGPSGENAGGLANQPSRTLYALIEPSYTYFGGSVIPHELTHQVYWDATHNPYSITPHWLSEGLATYLADGFDSYNKGLVRRAVADGTLMPLSAIRADFPQSLADRFNLSYAEGTSAVDYLVTKYGKPALNKLLLTYGKGSTDDEAFQAAIGKTIDAFGAEWLAAQGVTSTPTYGPLPAPMGPLPPGWTGPGSSPVASGSAEPSSAATPSPGATPGSIEKSAGLSRKSLSLLIAGVLAAVGLILLGVVVTIYATRRRMGDGPPA
jgi:hypothetical protein